MQRAVRGKGGKRGVRGGESGKGVKGSGDGRRVRTESHTCDQKGRRVIGFGTRKSTVGVWWVGENTSASPKMVTNKEKKAKTGEIRGNRAEKKKSKSRGHGGQGSVGGKRIKVVVEGKRCVMGTASKKLRGPYVERYGEKDATTKKKPK